MAEGLCKVGRLVERFLFFRAAINLLFNRCFGCRVLFEYAVGDVNVHGSQGSFLRSPKASDELFERASRNIIGNGRPVERQVDQPKKLIYVVCKSHISY